jgi:ABC-type transport system substrate-binding protein
MNNDDPSIGLGNYLRCDSIENRWTPGTDCDQHLEDLLDQVDGTTDQAERKAISDEIQLYVMGIYMFFPLYWEQEAVAFWPEARGYAHFPAPFGSWLKYQHMWIDPAHANDQGFSGQTTGLPGGGL